MTDNTTLYIQETHVNKTENHLTGEPMIYEPYTDNIGRLFLDLQREHGRCKSKVYIDLISGGHKAVGWVFEKRRQYTDCNDTYLHEVWVELLDGPPVRQVTYNYRGI